MNKRNKKKFENKSNHKKYHILCFEEIIENGISVFFIHNGKLGPIRNYVGCTDSESKNCGGIQIRHYKNSSMLNPYNDKILELVISIMDKIGSDNGLSFIKWTFSYFH